MNNYELTKDNYKLFVDKYFIRTKEILTELNLNPRVKIRLFVREKCKIYGINESIRLIKRLSNTEKIQIYALSDGSIVEPKETIMVIEAPIQDIVDLETLYLGIISAETTKRNIYDITEWGISAIYEKARRLVNIAKRPIAYFGARHWRYDRDAILSKMVLKAGFKTCSTDVGALNINSKGVGTIPHVLEAIMHWQYGIENAVFQSTKVFDEIINKNIPRIALIDYANKEIEDSLTVCKYIPNLYGIRVDTCGENVMQGANAGEFGVSISGVIALKEALIDNGFEDVKVFLTSGFGNEEKLQKFVDIEKELKYKLFDELGIGELYPSITTTADVVEVEDMEIHKVGRTYTPNTRLERVL